MRCCNIAEIAKHVHDAQYMLCYAVASMCFAVELLCRCIVYQFSTALQDTNGTIRFSECSNSRAVYYINKLQDVLLSTIGQAPETSRSVAAVRVYGPVVFRLWQICRYFQSI